MSTDPAFLANTAGCSRDLIENFVAYATKRIAPLRDGRIAVVYPFGMVDFIGHYAFDAHALRQLFPADRHQIFWICPRPTRQVNRAMTKIATREVVLIDADDFPVEDLVRLAVTIFLHSWAFQFGDHIFAFGGISRAVRELYYRHLRAGRPETPLRLTPDEEERADMLMRELGIEAGAEFAVLHVREGGYNQRDRFNSFRDSDIRKYDAAIDLLVRNGLTVVRIGDPSMRPLERKSPQIVDLAVRADKDPNADVYAIAKCVFMVHTGSGPTDLARAFIKPLIGTNYNFSEYWIPTPGSLFLPKGYFDRTNGRPLGLPEILNRRSTFAIKERELEAVGVVLRENESEEIEAACEQFIALRRGTIGSDTPTQRRYEGIHRQESSLRDMTGPVTPEYRYWVMDMPGALIAEAALRRMPDLLDGELLPLSQRPDWPPVQR